MKSLFPSCEFEMIERVNPLVQDCVASLKQVIPLLEKINDALYAETNGLPARSGVGAHLRHCIDFYECFLRGVKKGSANYNERERETLVERDRFFAITKLQIIISELESLPIEDGDAQLLICVENGDADEPSSWCRSSIKRELQFLLSHTTHHYALMGLMLKLMDHEVNEEFGATPSTLKYWKVLNAERGMRNAECEELPR
jgi:uncharacterized damage-inducible protein DinB